MRWRIWVDTGGTFTDGLAQAPDGSLRRTKILSSAALRGRVTRVIDGRRCLAETSWDASAGLVEGMRFRLLGDRSGETRVVGYDAAESILTLDAPLLTERCEGGSFELASDEEAPVLAARLLTRTPSGHPLPPADLRLATTLGTNALLTRSGAPTVLFVTAGFGDLSRIGDQRRPDLFQSDGLSSPAPTWGRRAAPLVAFCCSSLWHDWRTLGSASESPRNLFPSSLHGGIPVSWP